MRVIEFIKNTKYLYIFLFIFTLFLNSCGGDPEVDSEDIRSSGFYAEMMVQSSESDRAEVLVDLRLGDEYDSDRIVLSEGERLTATANGVTQELTKGDAYYQTTFDSDIGSYDVIISLERSYGISMPSSVVTHLGDLTINTPSEGDVFTIGDVVNFTWTPPEENVETSFILYADCYLKELTSEGDNKQITLTDGFITKDNITSYNLNVAALLMNDSRYLQIEKSMPCETRVYLERTREGDLDPGYGKGGYIKSEQYRRLNITINP